MSVRLPSYRLYKRTGQAVVTLSGRDIYLGKHDTPESRSRYDQVIAEWLANGRLRAPTAPAPTGPGQDGPTVSELILAYLTHADSYYVKDGQPTKEPGLLRLSYRPLRRLYGMAPAAEFGPRSLKAVRQAMLDADISRPEINRRVGRIVRMFKWGVENELIPPAVHHGLKAVAGLKRGRTEAREPDPVKPVADAHVDAIKPHVSRQVWAMVQLQRLTGMRPGEVCVMRTADIDTTGKVWTYAPRRHKTQHHGRGRTIFLGPQAQEVLRPWLRADREKYLFSPAEAMQERWEAQRQRRQSPVQPSQRCRKRARPKRQPGECYTPYSYRQSVANACPKAGVPHWHPHQLRHAAATRIRREHGLEAAQIILGHASADVTQVYAEADREKAEAIMGRIG